MKIRRVVTGHDEHGKSVIVSDGTPPRTKDFVHTPGFSMSIAWATIAGGSNRALDITQQLRSVVPGPGESIVHIVIFPPESVMQSSTFDFSAAVREHAEEAPGLIELFEPNSPGMHTTPTVDYAIVLEGEIWLELDDEEIAHLTQHDFVVQNGTRHAWRNKGSKPAKMAFILMGRAHASA